MMFRQDRTALRTAVSTAGQALPGRPAVAALAGILLSASDDRLEVSAYDMAKSLRVTTGLEACKPGRLLVPGKLFLSVLSSLPKGLVEVEEENGRVSITGGGAGFEIPSMPLEDYPSLPSSPPPVGWMEAEDFRSAVASVAYAVSELGEVSEVRMDGVRIEFLPDQVLFVATDRFRIPVARRAWKWEGDPQEQSVTVPPGALEMFAKAARGRIGISLPRPGGACLMGLSSEGMTLTTELYPGDYPNWRRAMPKDGSYVDVVVSSTEMTEALKRAVVVQEDFCPVEISVMDGCLQVSLEGESSMAEVVGAEVVGDEVTCTFNPGHMIQALACAPSPQVRFRVNPSGPSIVEDAEDSTRYQHVLMPQRRV